MAGIAYRRRIFIVSGCGTAPHRRLTLIFFCRFESPEIGRTQDANGANRSQDQKVLITGQNAVNSPPDRGAEDVVIIGIPRERLVKRGGFDEFAMFRDESNDLTDSGLRKTELTEEGPFEFVEDPARDANRVFRKTVLEHFVG